MRMLEKEVEATGFFDSEHLASVCSSLFLLHKDTWRGKWVLTFSPLLGDRSLIPSTEHPRMNSLDLARSASNFHLTWFLQSYLSRVSAHHQQDPLCVWPGEISLICRLLLPFQTNFGIAGRPLHTIAPTHGIFCCYVRFTKKKKSCQNIFKDPKIFFLFVIAQRGNATLWQNPNGAI